LTSVLLISCLMSVLPVTLAVSASASAPLVTSVPNMISVVTGTNGDLYWNGFYTDHWGGWQPLSGGSPSPPGLCQSGPGRVELVVEGYDENIYHKSFINGTWSPAWDKVPTGATDLQPACGVLGTTMHTVVRGTDTNLWANNLDLNTGAWSTWINLGGSSPSAPALAATPAVGALDLAVRGNDDKVYHTWYASGSWSTVWEEGCPPCGTYLRTVKAPAIVSGINRTGTHFVEVAISGWSFAASPGRSWGGGPSLHQGLPGFLDTPTLVVDPLGPPYSAGEIYAIGREFDGHIHLTYRSFDLRSDWCGNCFDAGGNSGNRPAGALLSSGNIAIVVSGGSKDLWYNTFTCCGSFSGWTAMTGSTSIDPGLITVP